MRMGKVHPTTEVARSVWCSPNSLPLSDVTVRTGGWAWRRKARWLARLKVAAARSVVFATTTYWVLRSAKTANPASLCCGPRKLSASQSPTGVWPPRPGAVGQYSARCEYTGTCRVDRSGAADPRVAHNAGNPAPSAPPPPEIDRSLRARPTAPVGLRKPPSSVRRSAPATSVGRAGRTAPAGAASVGGTSTAGRRAGGARRRAPRPHGRGRRRPPLGSVGCRATPVTCASQRAGQLCVRQTAGQAAC